MWLFSCLVCCYFQLLKEENVCRLTLWSFIDLTVCFRPDPNQAQQPILVCTAHIHWDPEFCDVKLIQTMMLSNELRGILDQEAANLQGVIEFLTSGRVPADHKDFKFDFKGIIDYIFYSKNSMTPLGLLGPLAPEWLRENKVVGCPHPHVPSDHFPLLVELEMIPTVPPASNGLTVPRR
ncbi:CCR4-NOT transcription complex subunit 6-like-B [Gryllus bimaculatus]|nr:CCR4-NOT transcription complex subunit 6-like-B [Gryllus bimaculatus]